MKSEASSSPQSPFVVTQKKALANIAIAALLITLTAIFIISLVSILNTNIQLFSSLPRSGLISIIISSAVLSSFTLGLLIINLKKSKSQKIDTTKPVYVDDKSNMTLNQILLNISKILAAFDKPNIDTPGLNNLNVSLFCLSSIVQSALDKKHRTPKQNALLSALLSHIVNKELIIILDDLKSNIPIDRSIKIADYFNVLNKTTDTINQIKQLSDSLPITAEKTTLPEYQIPLEISYLKLLYVIEILNEKFPQEHVSYFRGSISQLCSPLWLLLQTPYSQNINQSIIIDINREIKKFDKPNLFNKIRSIDEAKAKNIEKLLLSTLETIKKHLPTRV